MEEKTIKDLENLIYDEYYKRNPKGDARYDVWPLVIKAKKSTDPIKELKSILDSITLD